ncbi:DNA topoisomerase IB [Phenylobacterium sp.]|uniref:DNA topoisomerase IB n=1 Tax=Phenylobacterium sp. TaxID=1871053 RepID=UPI002E380E8C|nr:DNA topoisomerase IB [Phenylobacterium sp.]HEX3363947.1 DNA topoisomerase IB [Phenylobacterium sp.]
MARDLADPIVPAAELQAAHLTYVSDLDPGIRRRKAGHGFNYLDPEGRPVTAEPALDRIRKLAIPPAWTDVWIAPTERGHIQATGRDARGRKQYRYHARWRAVRDRGKYERLIAFGRALPRLRKQVERDLARRGLPREKVLAAVIRVMEITLIRIGNEEYAKTNRSFGLTTLRDRHANIGSEKAVFEFRGKSGKVHTTGFSDRRLARILKACQDLPGQRLFQYLDGDGRRHSVESADVNAYLRQAMGEDVSAKDFRTWAGTLVAACALVALPRCDGVGEAKANIVTCVKAVAGVLGNTPAVCRKAYIHPAVLDAYEAGALPLKASAGGRAFELAVLKFLERRPSRVP